MDIPLAGTLDIPDDYLERVEVQGGDGIEGDVEEDERPLEEGVGCVSYDEEDMSALELGLRSSFRDRVH